jgi:hypothetical protein
VERSSGGKLDIILLDELKRGSNRKELRQGTSTTAKDRERRERGRWGIGGERRRGVGAEMGRS